MQRSFCHVLILLLTYSIPIDGEIEVRETFIKNFTDPGYYLVTTIPEGATSINVTELTHTKNFLAVRLENGSYLFNDDYNINWSNSYKGAGTTFIYLRRTKDNLESFYALGPLTSSIDVMLGYQQSIPKVFYQYKLPSDLSEIDYPENELTFKELEDLQTSPTTDAISLSESTDHMMYADDTRAFTLVHKQRKKKMRVFWRATGYNTCSKTCGGGIQSKRYFCANKRTLEQVIDKRCRRIQKPQEVTARCNNSPCPPQWEPGAWGKCSVSCGAGTRKREFQCVQTMSDNLQVRVQNHHCPKNKPVIPSLESCHMPNCNDYTTVTKSTTVASDEPIELTTLSLMNKAVQPPKWKAEKWSSCSATCGNGKRTRTVICVTSGKPCNLQEKPITEEICNAGECKTDLVDNEIPESLIDSQWLFSAWPDECSAECGTGLLTRRLYCENYLKNSSCDEKKAPTMNRTCVSHQCGQWFAGPWTKCSSSCDIGWQTREVICISRFLGSWKVVNAKNCPPDKPERMKVCMGPACNATWFMSDWSQCSRRCGGGTQKRVVKCIGPDGMPMKAGETECDEESKPITNRNCHDVPCVAKTNQDRNCLDLLAYCRTIRQRPRVSMGKCQTLTYKKGCCKACRYASFINSQRE